MQFIQTNITSIAQLLAFWLTASLAVRASHVLALHVSHSVDLASRKLFASIASLGIGCLVWGLNVLACYLQGNLHLTEWRLLPAIASLSVTLLCCRLAVPILLTQSHWLLNLISSLAMSIGVMLAHMILVSDFFYVLSKINVLPFALAFGLMLCIISSRTWSFQRTRRTDQSIYAWFEWAAYGAAIVLLHMLLERSFIFLDQPIADAFHRFEGFFVVLMVVMFTFAVVVEQFFNMRSDKGRQQLFHHALSMIRSGCHKPDEQDVARLSLIADHLKDLTQADQVVMHFQPIANLSGHSIHLEALLRLKHPKLGFINPEHFFLVCELRGQTARVDRIILLNVLDQLFAWKQQEIFITVHINIAPVTLLTKDFSNWIKEEILKRMLEPTQIRLELTEHAIAANGSEMCQAVNTLQSLGIAVVMDDFGSGYSSIGMLADMQLAGIKCDRTLLRNIASDLRRQTLLRHVAAMAHELNIPVTVEGVETEAEMSCALSCSVENIQGYVFGRPMSAEKVSAWIESEGNERLLSICKAGFSPEKN